jgi:maleylpyruvate isomerase
MISHHGGRYSFGDTITMADCHLVPQVYSAERFGVALDAFPKILAVAARLGERPDVAAAHPDLQPDSDLALKDK